MSQLQQFKNALKLQTWANHKAQQEGTKTFSDNHKWINDKDFKKSLIEKWNQIAIKKKLEILRG